MSDTEQGAEAPKVYEIRGFVMLVGGPVDDNKIRDLLEWKMGDLVAAYCEPSNQSEIVIECSNQDCIVESSNLFEALGWVLDFEREGYVLGTLPEPPPAPGQIRIEGGVVDVNGIEYLDMAIGRLINAPMTGIAGWQFAGDQGEDESSICVSTIVNGELFESISFEELPSALYKIVQLRHEGYVFEGEGIES